MNQDRVKQTRQITISEKVFTLEDIRRIASIFDEQVTLSKQSDDRADVEYSIDFSDNTTFKSESPKLFSDVSHPAQPVQIQMSFRDYKLGRQLLFSAHHGDSSYGNHASVSAGETAWLSKNFLTLKDTLEAVKPQTVWYRRHRILTLSLIALGIGSCLDIGLSSVTKLLFQNIDFSGVTKPPSPDSPWRRVIESASPLLLTIKWGWRWFLGALWAHDLYRWLLDLRPNIEFDFGVPHLRTERMKRQRLMVVVALGLSILANLLTDVLKYMW